MNKNKIKDVLNEDHAGFAITLEVLATIYMLFMFVTFTLYFLRVMDVQRFMNTVMTSTAEQSARWGGVNSNAYKSNISTEPLLITAQRQLNEIAADYNPSISGSPDKIQNDGDEITIKISYGLPPIFSTMSKVNSLKGSYDAYEVTRNMSMKISVNSIMESGVLL